MTEMTLPSRQNSKFEPWWSEAKHATSRHGSSPHTDYFRVSRKETFVSLEPEYQSGGANPRSLTFQAGSFNPCNRAPAHVTNKPVLGQVQLGLENIEMADLSRLITFYVGQA